jgi:hypothetical protein
MGNNMTTIKLIIVLIILLVSFTILFSMISCADAKTITGDSPADPFNTELSFPNGAPRLNQAKELKCVVKSCGASPDKLAIAINLPDGLQLIDGNLSQDLGGISVGGIKEVKIIIKPTKVGNYKIEANFTFSSSRATYPDVQGHFLADVYLSVSESSAEWGKYPPWFKKGHYDVPVTPIPPTRAPQK